MAPCATALALYVALLLTRTTDGERLASPRHVRFDAEIAHHMLRWEPGNNPPSDVRYEVEHKVYGTNTSWTVIPNCMKIPEHFCDLTYYTLNSTLRYFARVRAVSGNHTSPWQRTSSFSPREANLRLSGQNLSVTGNTIHMQLQLLLRVGNLTVRYDDVQRHARRYLVYIRAEQDNRTYQVEETVPELNISNLFWDTKYCISVEPYVASRPNRAVRTDEQCITIGKRDRSAELIPSIVSSSFITVFLLGLLAALLVCTYIKKPVRPPSVLKSFIKQSSLWMEQESSSSGSLDAEPDPVQQLFLCQKEPQQDSGSNGSSSTAQLPLEKDWRLPAWTMDRVCPMGLDTMGSRDSSGTSTDSGICLRASSAELSCSSEPQGYKRQLPTGDDSGVGLESICPHPPCSSGSGTTSFVEPRQPYGEELSANPASSQQDVEFRGYLQQSKGTVEPRLEPDEETSLLGCTGSLQDACSTDVVLDSECSELAASKGYLKQSSEHHRTHAQDLAPWGTPQEPAAWHFSSQVGLQAPTLLTYGVPGAPLASKAGPELLKSPFDLGIFNTDVLGTLPLVSSLSPNEWLTLQINPLSLLNGDSKDSRL